MSKRRHPRSATPGTTPNILRPPPADPPASRRIPLWPGFVAAALCGGVYLFVGVGQFGMRPSQFCHHVLTANAWLQGRLYVTGDEIGRAEVLRLLGKRKATLPPGRLEELARNRAGGPHHDWIEFGGPGRYYAYWPPIPAVLMLPFVIVSGLQASDILVDNLIGALTVLFVYLALRELGKHWSALSPAGAGGLSVLYGLGTFHFWQACVGQVWFVTQLTGTLFLTIAIWFGLRALRRPAWILPAGLSLGLGFLSRNTIILAAPFLAVVLWLALRERPDRTRAYLKWSSLVATTLLLCIGLQLAFNHVRFGDWRDFGQGHLADAGGNPRFTPDFKRYGRFHPHFLVRNTWFYFLDPAFGILGGRRHPSDGGRTYDPDGNSLFLLSPAMVYMLLAWRRRAARPLAWWWSAALALVAAVYIAMVLPQYQHHAGRGGVLAFVDRNALIQTGAYVFLAMLVVWLVACLRTRDSLLSAVLAGAVPGTLALLLFHGTGFYAFGPRYLLDTMPFLLLLAAFGMRGRLTSVAIGLIAISIVVNAWGTYRFCLEQPP